MRQPLSLKARAVSLLSRREHSRIELRRKLGPHAKSDEELESVIEALHREGFFSEERFVNSLARRRSERFGLARIKQELNQHQLSPELVEPVLADLKASEFRRAKAIWSRRFGQIPVDRDERARQVRFLTQRGFSVSLALRVLQNEDDEAALQDGAGAE